MADLEITVAGTGIEEALRRLKPENAQRALILWFDRGTRYVRTELRNRAPGRLRGKTRIRTDGLMPPRWARIDIKSPLAHLIEGGTGSLGAPGFNHSKHWPNPAGIAAQTGLPMPEAFLVARAIGERGGNRAKPFIQPTFAAVQQPLVRLAQTCVEEAFK